MRKVCGAVVAFAVAPHNNRLQHYPWNVRDFADEFHFRLIVPRHDPKKYVSYILDDPEFGRMAYTISILLMFSFVILLLMIRSIKRSSSTIQVSHHSNCMHRMTLNSIQR